ncbi:MAG: hypothetical protein ABIH89_03850 [Elusimicrobiota bacterium]
MVGKIIAFWFIWFIVSITIGKIWPSSVDGQEKVIPLSFGNGIIGFIVTVLLVTAIKAIVLH